MENFKTISGAVKRASHFIWLSSFIAILIQSIFFYNLTREVKINLNIEDKKSLYIKHPSLMQACLYSLEELKKLNPDKRILDNSIIRALPKKKPLLKFSNIESIKARSLRCLVTLKEHEESYFKLSFIRSSNFNLGFKLFDLTEVRGGF